MFEPVKKFVFNATAKYQLEGPALGALMCEKSRQVIRSHYPQFELFWEPTKYVKGSLTIRAKGSSGAELFMQTQVFMQKLNALELPQTVQQIKIVKV